MSSPYYDMCPEPQNAPQEAGGQAVCQGDEHALEVIDVAVDGLLAVERLAGDVRALHAAEVEPNDGGLVGEFAAGVVDGAWRRT
jgi:hypothetical protein